VRPWLQQQEGGTNCSADHTERYGFRYRTRARLDAPAPAPWPAPPRRPVSSLDGPCPRRVFYPGPAEQPLRTFSSPAGPAELAYVATCTACIRRFPGGVVLDVRGLFTYYVCTCWTARSTPSGRASCVFSPTYTPIRVRRRTYMPVSVSYRVSRVGACNGLFPRGPAWGSVRMCHVLSRPVRVAQERRTRR